MTDRPPPPLSAHEQQRRSFAYGNVHADNEHVTRADIDAAAEQLATTAPDYTWPRCACGRIAYCIGSYEMWEMAYACDACCAHGNEDGRCWPLADLPTTLNAVLRENLALRSWRDAALRGDQDVLLRALTEDRLVLPVADGCDPQLHCMACGLGRCDASVELRYPGRYSITGIHRRCLEQLPLPDFSPVPLVLTCPSCETPHVDEGELARKPHRSHVCHACGRRWRPRPYPTVGVDGSPGRMDLDRSVAR